MRTAATTPLLLLLLATACVRTAPGGPRPGHAPSPASGTVSQAGAMSTTTIASRDAAAMLLVTRGLVVPVAGMDPSRIPDSFDEPRDGGRRRHNAIDILAPRGTPVLAADDGEVLRVSTSQLGGKTVYATDPERRFVYYYAHLDAYHPRLAQGMHVSRGDTLGFVGTTGNAPANVPHLHFQVMLMSPDGRYWDGEPLNPYAALVRGTR